jgi:hypothetical protein
VTCAWLSLALGRVKKNVPATATPTPAAMKPAVEIVSRSL